MSKIVIFNPRRPMFCFHCGELVAGVIIREVKIPGFKLFVCGQCLALAMQDITKQNWLSQWKLWQANSALGKQIRQEKENAAR